MKKHVTYLFLIMLLVAIAPIVAQENTNCDAEDISQLVDNAYIEYEATRRTSDSATSLEDAENFQSTLDYIISNCSDVIATNVSGEQQPGSGTLNDPYLFNRFADSGDGILIRVSGLVRPADRTIRNENMFNDRPEADEEYVIVFVDIRCASSRTDTCDVSGYDFELAGDNGVIYEDEFVVYDDALDVNVRSGGEGSGGLPFLIQSDDTNLGLTFYPEGRYGDIQVVYSAEPSAADGITILSTSSLNVRGGPSTNFSVIASLQSGEEAIAFGRNDDGTWLQIQIGWVFADLVEAGDVMQLAVTSE